MLALALALAGCESPSEPTSFRLVEPFDLRPGQTAIVELSLRIKFESVPVDSRCPSDVVCIQAGDAVVKVSISAVGQQSETHELHTNPMFSDALYQAYAIRLQRLTPLPRSDRPVAPGDYVATLIVGLQ